MKGAELVHSITYYKMGEKSETVQRDERIEDGEIISLP